MKKFWKQDKHYLGFNDIPFMIFGIPILSILVSMMFFGVGLVDSTICFLHNPFIASFFTALFWLGDRTITIYLRKRFPNAHDLKKRLYLQGIAILIYTTLMSFPLMMGKPYFEHTFGPEVQHPNYFKSLVSCLFATVLITTIYEAGYFLHKWKVSIAETETLKQQNTASQLEALRNQINPHFLFNSLNTLAGIIPEDPKNAVDFVHKLSNVYRKVLELKDIQVVSLKEELEYLDNYIFLLKSRFGDNLQFKIDLHDTCLDCFLVPLSLQMLVENSIKHNIVSSKRPLIIEIYNETPNNIFVRNNLQIKTQSQESTGTGLLNIKNRFELTFGKHITISETADYFTVELPLIPIANYESDHH